MEKFVLEIKQNYLKPPSSFGLDKNRNKNTTVLALEFSLSYWS